MRNRILLLAALLTTAATARAQTELDEQPFGIGLETGGVWFSRNDIRIPSDTGDEFVVKHAVVRHQQQHLPVDLFLDLLQAPQSVLRAAGYGLFGGERNH